VPPEGGVKGPRGFKGIQRGQRGPRKDSQDPRQRQQPEARHEANIFHAVSIGILNQSD